MVPWACHLGWVMKLWSWWSLTWIWIALCLGVEFCCGPRLKVAVALSDGWKHLWKPKPRVEFEELLGICGACSYGDCSIKRSPTILGELPLTSRNSNSYKLALTNIVPGDFRKWQTQSDVIRTFAGNSWLLVGKGGSSNMAVSWPLAITNCDDHLIDFHWGMVGKGPSWREAWKAMLPTSVLHILLRSDFWNTFSFWGTRLSTQV